MVLNWLITIGGEVVNTKTVNHEVQQARMTPVQQERFRMNVARIGLPEEARGAYHCVMCNRPFPENAIPADWVCFSCGVRAISWEKITSKRVR